MNSARSHSSSILVNKTSLWISGGLGDKGSLSSTEIIHSEGTFEECTELPEPIAYHCTSQLNSTHLIIAGNVYPNHNQVYMVDTTNNPFKFTSLPNMLKQRWGCACAVITSSTLTSDGSIEEDVQILVAGGDFPTYKSTELYSFKNQKWEDGPQLPTGFYYGGYTQRVDDFILIGGWDGSTYTTGLTRYNQEKNNFEFLYSHLKIGRSRFGTIVVDREDYCT